MVGGVEVANHSAAGKDPVGPEETLVRAVGIPTGSEMILAGAEETLEEAREISAEVGEILAGSGETLAGAEEILREPRQTQLRSLPLA